LLSVANSETLQGVRSIPELKNLNLHCEACEKTFNHGLIVKHFLSKARHDGVFDENSVVSRAAFEYWMDKLKTAASAIKVGY
ncbi:hypothetical protein PENTCL1PPCAC_8, partial [Pristionchus entomophagus]